MEPGPDDASCNIDTTSNVHFDMDGLSDADMDMAGGYFEWDGNMDGGMDGGLSLRSKKIMVDENLKKDIWNQRNPFISVLEKVKDTPIAKERTFKKFKDQFLKCNKMLQIYIDHKASEDDFKKMLACVSELNSQNKNINEFLINNNILMYMKPVIEKLQPITINYKSSDPDDPKEYSKKHELSEVSGHESSGSQGPAVERILRLGESVHIPVPEGKQYVKFSEMPSTYVPSQQSKSSPMSSSYSSYLGQQPGLSAPSTSRPSSGSYGTLTESGSSGSQYAALPSKATTPKGSPTHYAALPAVPGKQFSSSVPPQPYSSQPPLTTTGPRPIPPPPELQSRKLSRQVTKYIPMPQTPVAQPPKPFSSSAPQQGLPKFLSKPPEPPRPKSWPAPQLAQPGLTQKGPSGYPMLPNKQPPTQAPARPLPAQKGVERAALTRGESKYGFMPPEDSDPEGDPDDPDRDYGGGSPYDEDTDYELLYNQNKANYLFLRDSTR